MVFKETKMKVFMTPETLKDLTNAGLNAVEEHFRVLHDEARAKEQEANCIMVGVAMEQFRRKNAFRQKELDYID